MIRVQVKDGLPITPEQSAAILQHESDTFGVYFDLYRIREYHNYHSTKMFEPYYLASNAYNIDLSKDDTVIGFLYNKVRNKEVFFYRDKSGMRSNNASINEYVRGNIKKQESDNEVVMQVISMYENYKSSRVAVSSMESYLKLKPVDILSRDGHPMVIGHPRINILATFRLSYLDPGVQTISRSMQDIITAPMGYSIVHCDSSQLEPRITYSAFVKDKVLKHYIEHYNDAYYGILAYVQLDDETYYKREELPIESLPLPEISPEFKEMRKTMKTLALAVGYGSTVNTLGVQQEIFDRYVQRIAKNPYMVKWLNDVKSYIDRGGSSFYTAFGTKITPQATDKVTPNDGSRWRRHLERAGINNPVQGTAADLMHISVYNAYNIIKGRDAHVACYIHDAGIFYVRDGDYEVIKQLSDITAYDVWDGDYHWIQIPAESEVNAYASSIGSRFDSNTLYRCIL